MSVEVKRVDTVSAQVPVPATVEETRRFLGLLAKSADEGYTLVGATEITTGQRDPYTIGLKITLERQEPR